MGLRGVIFRPPAMRAPFACRPEDSRGRLYAEDESPTRTAFQRDRDRILHSTAFRRLKHKTQVFVYHEGDHFRTRLTHSLEVAQIARSICRVLALDEDLAETLALAHDLGHTPFGHAGEEALDWCMRPYGGFDHNAQTLRIVTTLEQRYAAFDGLNLTWETLEGLAKHNGPVLPRDSALRQATAALPWALSAYQSVQDLELHTWPGAEAQVAALSDDIAYNNHDIDDGLRAELFTIEDLYALPMVGPVFLSVVETYPRVERARQVHEAIRRLVGLMIEDVIAETKRRLAVALPQSADSVRRAGRPLIGFSPEMEQNDRALKEFLHARMYRHYKVSRTMSQAKRVVRELFERFLQEPELLPPEWSAACASPESAETARVVSDFIAGMTDRFAIEEHRRLFDLSLSLS